MEVRLVRIAGILSLTILLASSGSNTLHVERINAPDYPFPARYDNVQGTVNVNVDIGPDGRVTSARGSGAPEILVKAAEDNAKTWIFGPFPPVEEFPIYHTIQYVYKLEGKPKAVAYPPVIHTFLPDRIEVTAVPLFSDYPPLDKYNPIPRK